MSTTAKIILAITTTIAVIAGVYTLYWWVSKDSTQRRYDVNTQTQQYQAGLIAAERDRAQGFTIATDPGQRANLKNSFCTVYLNVEAPVPADLVSARSAMNCP